MRSLNCIPYLASIAYAKTTDEFGKIQQYIIEDVAAGRLSEDDAAMLRQQIETKEGKSCSVSEEKQVRRSS